MVGGQAAAREPVEEHGRAERLGEGAQLRLAARPVEVGAGHDHRPLGLAQQRDRALERAPVGPQAADRRRGAGSGSGSSASMNTWSSGRSRNVGPPWGRSGHRERLVDEPGHLRRRARGLRPA